MSAWVLDFYDSEPEFARWIDRGAELLKPMLGLDLRIFICHCGPVPESMADEQRNTRIAQPCLYLVEYALARLWMSRGLRPYAMIGHSVGEFVAATLANAISFEDGLRLVASRGRLMQSQPQGAMVSVRADAQTVSAYLKGDVEIAAVNAPKLSVISGPFAEIDEVCSALEAGGIAFSRLHTSHAFHSPMMDEAAAALYEETAKVTYGTATLPYISLRDRRLADGATGHFAGLLGKALPRRRSFRRWPSQSFATGGNPYSWRLVQGGRSPYLLRRPLHGTI